GLLLPWQVENCRAWNQISAEAWSLHVPPEQRSVRQNSLPRQLHRLRTVIGAGLLCSSPFRHSFTIFLLCFVSLLDSLLNSPQAKCGTEKCNPRPSQQNDEIVKIKMQIRAVHVHQSKSAAKMCQRKQFGYVTDGLRQLFEWSKCS